MMNLTVRRKLRRAGRTAPRRGASAGAMIAAAMGGAFVSAALLTAGFARSTISADTFRQLDLFGEVFEQVHENYVTEPDDGELIKGAIDGMISKLDPHSSYLSAEDYDTMQEQTRGSFEGLGIQAVMENEGPDKGLVKIVAPIDDTPAQRAGLQTNDLIVKINGDEVQGLSIDEAIAKLKGPRGTAVEISILRDREKPPFDVKLVRDTVNVPSVVSRAEGEFGYIRISTFSEQTEEGVNKALKKLDKEIKGGAKGLILDLRTNPGGLLDQAVAVADAFLDGGEIVSTRGRRPKDTLREMGTPGDAFTGRPMIVLINGGSASASEIVAGALQDRNRALLIGTKSFGKGSVQTVIPLQNGLQGALRLTTAKYYTPSGRSIQSLGIDPDIAMPVIYPGQEEVAKRQSEKDLPGAFAPEVPTPQQTVSENAGEDKEETSGVKPVECPLKEDGSPEDCQLKRALDILADATTYRRALADAGAARRQ
ncbi:MAG: S41 family peptidase [Amphiplicatus sp.]